jgi:hypothetical protein
VRVTLHFAGNAIFLALEFVKPGNTLFHVGFRPA